MARRVSQRRQRRQALEEAGVPRRPRGALLLPVMVGAAALLVYLNALDNGLVYDDHFLIERNRFVLNRDWAGVWATHYWGGYEGNETGQYRPLTVLSFVFDGMGGIDPVRYHLTNIFLHALNSVLAFWVCRRIGIGIAGAAAGGLLFAVHPLHAEAAAGVTFGRADLLGGGFVMAGLLLYASAGRRRLFYGLSLAAFFFGLLSKESAVTLAGLVVLYDLAFHRKGAGWRDVWRTVRDEWPRWAGFAAVFGGYLLLRRTAAGLGFAAGSLDALNNPLVGAGMWARLLTAARLLWKYAAMVVLPIRLSVDYSYNAIPVAASPLAPDVIAGAMLGVGGLWLWLRAFGRQPRAFFCAGLFWVPYAAVSQVPVVLNAMFQERFLYVPVLGIFALLGLGVERLRARRRTLTLAVVGLAALACAGRTLARNRDWRDDLTLYASAVRACPESAKMHHALGDALAEQGRLDRAIASYRRALDIREEPQTYNNLGNVYTEKGAFAKAMGAYRRAVALQPDFAQAWANLGLTALRAGQAQAAAEALRRAAGLRPDDAEVHYNLGTAWSGAGRPDLAAPAYEQAVALRPGWAEAYFNLGNAYRDLGKPEAAVRAYQGFLETWRGDPRFAEMARAQIRAVEQGGNATTDEHR